MNLESKHRSMRILKILEIEREHKLHRERLHSINSSVKSLFHNNSESHSQSKVKLLARQQRRR